MQSRHYKIIKSIAVITMTAMLFSCKNDIDLIRSFEDNENTPISSTFDMQMMMTDSGDVKIKLMSDQVDHYEGEKDYMEMPLGLHLYFYDSIGNIKSELTAKYAINHIDQMKMEAKHNVVARNRNNERLITEHLIWDQKTHKIYTHEKVTIITADETLLGEGLTADEEFLNWEIINPTGSFNIETPDDK